MNLIKTKEELLSYLSKIGYHKQNYRIAVKELREEFDQELAADQQGLEIEIDRVLEVRQVQFEEKDHGVQDWIVVSHLCFLRKGIPGIGEPGKIDSLHEITLDELYVMDESILSRSTIAARLVYKEQYGNQSYYNVIDATDTMEQL